MTHDEQQAPAWHSLSIDDVLARVDASRDGLTNEEARRRLEEHGPNRLPVTKPLSWLKIFLHQFASPLIVTLIVAGIVAALAGETTDAAFIAAVLVINAIIGGFQEWKAEKSSHALQSMMHSHATVKRSGHVVDVDAEEIVPGDVATIEPGVRVTADMRLISSNGLEIDESLLTGESVAVEKDADWIGGDVSTPVGDRLNMAYAGSMVSRGRGKAVVVGTATDTEVGRLAISLGDTTGGKPPLLIRMARFSRAIGIIVVFAATAAAVLGSVLRGWSLTEMFMFGVALAVAAIPEGLPVALTVALAVATNRMAQRGVIARRLAAVEGLGSCTYIATDKTGTLTRNELTVRLIAIAGGQRFSVTGPGNEPEGEIEPEEERGDPSRLEEVERLLRTAVLCNEAELRRGADGWDAVGDPTDVALLVAGGKAGFEREQLLRETPEVGSIPFESENRYAALFVEAPGREANVIAHVKGGVEQVLSMCAFDAEADADAAAELATDLSAEGFRVLAFAAGAADRPAAKEQPGPPRVLGFLGFACMIDPLREGAADAVASCNSAGIVVTMVTGDHPITALAIARELGLADSMQQVVTGSDIEVAGPDGLPGLIEATRVYARMSPHQKLDLVNAAREAGHFVAVTGDGVNDAPALRAANLGVAMGKAGTDVAREASDLVITDDDFTTIVTGIEQGRIAYDNVRKVGFLLVSTGAAEVFLIMGALVLGLPVPLLAVQLLWLNLVTNSIQDVALAFERSEGDVLERPPRAPNERIFDRLMIERTLVSAVTMSAIALGVLWYVTKAGMEMDAARNMVLLLMVFFENVQVGNSRSERKSIFRHSPLKSPILLTGTLAALGVHIASLFIPFMQRALGTAPVDFGAALILAALAMTLAATSEVHKWFYRRRHPRKSDPVH
ncbi:MAG: HAD-IC family P-type ATPase [Planctomycetota bacterium]